MPEAAKRRNQPIKMTKEPVQPESVLYRILQQMAKETARSVGDVRVITDGTARESEGG